MYLGLRNVARCAHRIQRLSTGPVVIPVTGKSYKIPLTLRVQYIQGNHQLYNLLNFNSISQSEQFKLNSNNINHRPHKQLPWVSFTPSHMEAGAPEADSQLEKVASDPTSDSEFAASTASVKSFLVPCEFAVMIVEERFIFFIPSFSVSFVVSGEPFLA
ncbi:hypothetical protein TWF569_004133 [Orbilia oligospora]|uniref:Uncharacterized protein n=1 Tax=Orbilia oligospora TaxID=2813651 RepID=A0A7C8NAX4_ORBOL|nr:hypothetical protein TWF706_011303 [Orbilia oligospora]KAF3094909.1 hypothetical protein TWF103_010409 [Orbilia oligospora]KAF3095555.1 hypothetical protein TWF102_007266 [Orbilia oligospora]KAF3151148.1 hypothetical protein TWF569_004133 [Orbilia oligospora]